jgi:hypothetical protein
MDDTTRAAIRAFYRLLKTTDAATTDPLHPGSEETLTNAANEAHHAMKAAGLLDLPHHEVFALVRELYPDFDPQQ